MRTLFFLFLATSFFLLSACEGPVGPEGPTGPEGPQGSQGPQGAPGDEDKQIRFDFNFPTRQATGDTTGRLLPPATYLLKFDTNNYADVDSAVFTVSLNSRSADNVAYAALYNVDEDTVIAGSTVQTQSTEAVWEEASGIFEQLPTSESTLGVFIWTENQGTLSVAGAATLFLYRD